MDEKLKAQLNRLLKIKAKFLVLGWLDRSEIAWLLEVGENLLKQGERSL